MDRLSESKASAGYSTLGSGLEYRFVLLFLACFGAVSARRMKRLRDDRATESALDLLNSELRQRADVQRHFRDGIDTKATGIVAFVIVTTQLLLAQSQPDATWRAVAGGLYVAATLLAVASLWLWHWKEVPEPGNVYPAWRSMTRVRILEALADARVRCFTVNRHRLRTKAFLYRASLAMTGLGVACSVIAFTRS